MPLAPRGQYRIAISCLYLGSDLQARGVCLWSCDLLFYHSGLQRSAVLWDGAAFGREANLGQKAKRALSGVYRAAVCRLLGTSHEPYTVF